VTIRLDPHYYKGRQFTVITRSNSPQNLCIQSATLNGRPLNRAWIRYSEIVAGGTVEFTMVPQPNESWGAGELPPSWSRD